MFNLFGKKTVKPMYTNDVVAQAKANLISEGYNKKDITASLLMSECEQILRRKAIKDNNALWGSSQLR